MDKVDARFQTLDRLHLRRKQVVRLHGQGFGVMRIVALSGLSYPTVRVTIDRYREGGAAAVKPARRGKHTGQGRSVSVAQEASIQRIICDQRPEQVKMEFALWSRAAVMKLIERECGITLSVRGVGTCLSRWGFTPQKPIRKAYEQRSGAVQAGLTRQYREIERRARAEGAEIHWGGETALVNTGVRGRSCVPAGKTPVAYAVCGTRLKLSMIATVTNQGKTRWMIIDDALHTDRLIEFLAALIRDAGRKVFLILDNQRVHHARQVRAWVAERADRIELFYLPSYSPERNPEARLTAHLNYAIGSNVPARTRVRLKDAATEHTHKPEQSPGGFVPTSRIPT